MKNFAQEMVISDPLSDWTES